jgi:prophage antirepressor-like protein
MKNIFETLDENYIKYDKYNINVIIDNTDKLWFNANQLTKSFEYSNYIKALKQHTSDKDRVQLKNINHSYNIKQHPQTVYLSESGLYKLILRSKMKKAQSFSDWITNDVLPSIRKYGYYKMKKTYEKDKNDLLDKINYLEKQNKLMINDMKKEKYPKGALVYFVDYSNDDGYEKDVYRLGATDDMNKRRKIYDTHMLHKRPVVIKEFINNPTRLEMCIRSMLYDYRYKNKKDFFMCELRVIKKAFRNCLKSIKNMNQQGGSNINELNKLRNDLNELDKKIIEINKIL